MFNSSLMNKLIRIEWMSAIRLPTKLMDVTIHEQKSVYTFKVENVSQRCKRLYSNKLKTKV